jgi:hypothetical protein
MSAITFRKCDANGEELEVEDVATANGAKLFLARREHGWRVATVALSPEEEDSLRELLNRRALAKVGELSPIDDNMMTTHAWMTIIPGQMRCYYSEYPPCPERKEFIEKQQGKVYHLQIRVPGFERLDDGSLTVNALPDEIRKSS